jgi:hypothetical protein
MKTNAQAFAACVQHTAFIPPSDLNPKAYPAKTYKHTFDHQLYCALSNSLNNSISLHDQNINPSDVSGYFMNCPPWYFQSSTFCTQSAFMSTVWISEQKARIFLYSINCLAFITDTQYVYCAERFGSLSKIPVNLSLQKHCRTSRCNLGWNVLM